jgi:DNA replication protein DnaC
MYDAKTFPAFAASLEKVPHCAECGPRWTTKRLSDGSDCQVRNLCEHEQAERQRLTDEHLHRDHAVRRFEQGDTGVPEALRQVVLADVDARDCAADGRAAAARYVETWPERRSAGHGLMLAGDIGTGKTMLAAAIGHELARRHGVLVAFTTVTEFQTRMRDFDHAPAAMAELKGCDLLILDDFGQEKATEWAASQLFDLIDHRTQAKRPTIFTSNLGAAGMADHYIRCLTNGKDQMPFDQAKITVERILSRIRERNARVTFIGPDQRALVLHDWLESEAP